MHSTKTDPLLQQAITALKAGRKTQACTLLAQAVQQDPGDERVWLWLSGAVDCDEQRRACLERVLALNPHNDAALRGLASLQPGKDAPPSHPASPPLPQPSPAPVTTGAPLREANAFDAAQGQTRLVFDQNGQRKRFWRWVGAGIALAVGMFVIAIILSLTGGKTEDSRLSRIEPLYELPYVVVYGRKTCGLTRRMMENLDQRDVRYTFKSMDDQAVRDEVFPRMRAAGLDTRHFMLPVVDVNGWLLLDTPASVVADRYHHP